MKKILLLGGSSQQVVAIKTAKKLGYYTVLCDYLPDNPGRLCADRFYLTSTTDKQAILDVAIKESIQGILAYASDPAAPTAAYVAEKMNLSGNPYKSVEILCNKEKFRDFLQAHDFHTPAAKGYASVEEAMADLRSDVFSLPVMVKPVDSSGSKGVGRIDSVEEAENAIKTALNKSRQGRIIIEEYVECAGYQVAGDGLSINGELSFRCFANDHFDPLCVNPFVPVSASFPYIMDSAVQDAIHSEIQRLLCLLDMGTTAYNFDIRVDHNYNVYLMEIAPRDGGNYIPDVIRYATGVDLLECSIKAAMGEPIDIGMENNAKGFWSYYAVHCYEDGVLDRIIIDEEVRKNNIVEDHIIYKQGDRVKAFSGANTTLGILVMKFDSMQQMLHMMDHSDEWIKVVIKR